MNPETAAVVPHARLKLALMFLLPGLAVLLATLVFYTGIGLPRATTNKGVLVQPPRQMDELALTTGNGTPWRYAGVQRGWGILVTGHGSCEEACRARIAQTRQVHVALGRDAERVQRYYLAADAAPEADFGTWLVSEQPDLQFLGTDSGSMRGLLARAGEPDPLDAGTIYLVDPRGFVMMVYLPAHPGRAVLDDLRFLLRNSAD